MTSPRPSQSQSSSITLEQYITWRLGKDKSPLAMFGEMFVRSFTAPSVAEFWRYWNPGYGYYLGRYIYRPLTRVLPHWLGVILTFAFSGFVLHDLITGWPIIVYRRAEVYPPFVATWFVLIALVLLFTEGIGLRLDRVPRGGRVLFHLAVLISTGALAMWAGNQFSLSL